MEQYTLKQRIQIIKIHCKHGENLEETVRKTKIYLGLQQTPCRTAIKKLLTQFELLGHVRDLTTENIADLAQSDEENPEDIMADTEAKRKGRPKKRESEAVEAPAKSPPKKAAISNGDDAVPAKRGRGRPPKAVTKASKKPPPVPGRGRGRPPSKPAAAASKKKDTSDEEEEDEEDDEEEEEKKDSSGDADSS